MALFVLVGTYGPPPAPPEPIAASADAEPALTVSSLTAGPGEPLTVSGTGCDREAQLWLVAAPGTAAPTPVTEPTARVRPDPRGRWETVVVVPPDAPDWRLEVGCFDDRIPPGGFVYPSPVESADDA